MKRGVPVFSALVAGFAVVLLATPLQADIIWNLDHEFSGATPPVGELKVELNDKTGGVELIVDATLLVGSEHVKELYLNVDLASLLPLAIVSDPYPPTTPNYYTYVISQIEDNFKADGDGLYDILFEFGNSGDSRLNAGEKATFWIEGGSGFDASSFEAFSAPDGGHGPFYVAAHVGGIGGNDDSGWVTDDGNGEVPEASTLMLFGGGLIGILGFLKRRAPFLAGR